MVFSSIAFLVYFLPLVLLLYVVIPARLKNPFLLVASILFYSWGAPRFIFVILGTTFLDFFLVKEMAGSEGRKRNLFLVLSIAMNMGLLFYFKYCNFFIGNVNVLLSAAGIGELRLLSVVLPIGISFYTFESITYVVDVYRRVHAPLRNFWHYQLYIILFPKLIAGPIIRYHEIADQITGRLAFETTDDKLSGFFRFVIGLSKKVFIANTLAVYADEVFATSPDQLSAMAAWTGVLSYTFQIYFDFSGYSDMAIGLGRFFGFRFPENFNNPYTSGSITEFWQRWHITLGKWMRDYLYIPLGGNRVKSDLRLYFNLWLVFLASGFWHGAAWTFVIWGIYHGSFLVLERLFLLRFYRKAGKFFSVLITFFIVSIGWVFFRADTAAQAIAIIGRLFSGGWQLPLVIYDRAFLFYLLLAVFFSFFVLMPGGKSIQEKVFAVKHRLRSIVAYALVCSVLLTIAIASITATDFNPFIYFRF